MSDAITLEAELRKNKEIKMEDLHVLKDWYALQTHLPPITDELLVRFYHSCWNKIELTKSALDNYFTFRTHNPEFFEERDPFTVNMRNGKQVVEYMFLGNTTPENYRVMLTKLLNVDPSAYVPAEVSKSLIMHYDLELYLNGTADGDIIIIDMEGVSLGHLARLSLTVSKKMIFYVQEAMPVRLISMHFINVVPFIDKIMAITRPFMKKEFMEKFHFHTEGLESLFKFVPQKILPKDFGGDDKSCSELSGERLQLLQKYKSWFVEEGKLRVDESKRPGKSKPRNEIFGVDGSFKKLEVD